MSESKNYFCSFCRKSRSEVSRLICVKNEYNSLSFICENCIKTCSNVLDKHNIPSNILNKILKPSELQVKLDEIVYGQSEATKEIARIVYYHYLGIKELGNQFKKTNVIIIAPTGTGKTLICETLAKILNVPCVIYDSTPITEAGYVGKNAEDPVSDLLKEAKYDVQLAQLGIMMLDEIDKKCNPNRESRDFGSSDISREAVQRSFLKIVEGTKVEVTNNQQKSLGVSGETFIVDTTQVLFFAVGAFVNLDNIVAKRLQGSRVVNHFTNKINPESETISLNKKQHDYNSVMKHLIVEDLIAFGLLPEFVGRFQKIIVLNALDVEALVNILAKIKGAVLNQYQELLKLCNAECDIELRYEEVALKIIAEKALQYKTGARALRSIVDRTLSETMFNLPSLQANKKKIIVSIIPSENNKDVETKIIYQTKREKVISKNTSTNL